MVSEAGDIVEVFFTPSRCSDVRGLQCYHFDLPEGSKSMPTKLIAIMVLKMPYKRQASP